MYFQNNTDSKSLRILYWNARSINKRKKEIPALLQNIDIFLCVESWLQDPADDDTNNQDFTFAPGFVQLQKNRHHSRGGGILIMIRKSIAFQEIQIQSPDVNVELCKIRLTNTNPSIDIVVCYRAKGTLSQEQWNLIASYTDQNHPSLLIGDFNSHNIIWNCSNTDKNGKMLANSIEDYNLFLHNPDSLTRINPINCQHSNIDLVFSTLNLAQKINTQVLDETLGSDHYPILCSIDLDKNLYKKKSFKIKTLRTNWNTFTKELDSNFSTFLSYDFDNSDAEKKYETFTETIINSLKISTPVKKNIDPSKYKNLVPWWDEECNKIIRLRKAAYKKWNFRKTLTERINYNKLNCITAKILKKKKKNPSKSLPKL